MDLYKSINRLKRQDTPIKTCVDTQQHPSLHSSPNPPIARTASTTLRYSLSNSPTSDTRRSSSAQVMNRALGGEMRIDIGDCGRDDIGDSTCRDGPTWVGTSSDDGRDVGGEACVYDEFNHYTTFVRKEHSAPSPRHSAYPAIASLARARLRACRQDSSAH